jgi:glycerol-3-phosphate dehydrogenase
MAKNDNVQMSGPDRNFYDVIIIGGGVTGSAIARELSRYRIKAALLEKEAELAFGVSKSNSGIIHPGTQNPPDSLKGKLCVQGNKLVRRIAAELGVDFQEVGELIIVFSSEDLPALEKIKADAEKLGVPGLRIVDRSWLDEHEPNLSKDIPAALYAPTAGIISPYRLVYDLSENARLNGVKIHSLTEVLGIERLDRSDGARFRIKTTHSDFYSNYIINAAGLFADEIAAMAGVRDFKITPRKGEEFLLDKKRENLTGHLIFPLPTKESKGTLMIKTSDGNPMIGPTAEMIDDKEDLSTSDAGLKNVLGSVSKMVPSVDGKDIIAYFAGLRPVAGDDFIIRHEDKAPGFINVAGIQSPGLTAAPAIALMVIDILKQNGLRLRKKLFFKRYRKRSVHLFSITPERTKQLIAKNKAFGDIVCRCEMVSSQEIKDAIERGAVTMDGIKFRTRAQAGRCHGGFCTTRIMKILAEKTGLPLTKITKRGPGSEIIKKEL